MRLITASAFAVLLTASAAAYAADETAPAPTPSEGQAQPEKPKKVCRMETATGSVMPKRVCRTQEQIEADARATERQRQQIETSRGGV